MGFTLNEVKRRGVEQPGSSPRSGPFGVGLIDIMYYVYFIKSIKDGYIYIGVTGDLEKRLNKHNGGGNRSTRLHKPFRLIYSEDYRGKTEALKRERYFKSPKGYLEKLKILDQRGVEQPGSSSGS